MSSTDSETPGALKAQIDYDIAAVRAVIEEAEQPEFDPEPVIQKWTTPGGSETPDQGESGKAKPSNDAKGSTEPSWVKLAIMHGLAWCLNRIKTYRPERKRILLTSLVLLLLLKPFFVIGWTAVGFIAVVLTFAILGADAFWRKVIDLYRLFARRKPAAARQLKIRAYLVARKWDRILQLAPAGLADQLRPPDLRDIVAADARHETAMQDRLQKIYKEDTSW